MTPPIVQGLLCAVLVPRVALLCLLQAAYMPQHLQPPSSNMPGMPSGEGNSKSHSEQSKLSKPPSNDAASVALASELSEAHVLPSISSMDGRPSTKVGGNP